MVGRDVLRRGVRRLDEQIDSGPRSAVGALVDALDHEIESRLAVLEQERGAGETVRSRRGVDDVSQIVQDAVEVALLRVDEVGQLTHELAALIQQHHGVAVRVLERIGQQAEVRERLAEVVGVLTEHVRQTSVVRRQAIEDVRLLRERRRQLVGGHR